MLQELANRRFYGNFTVTRCVYGNKAVDTRAEHTSDVTHSAAVSFSLRQLNVLSRKYLPLDLATDIIL
jgi:hypothetical protein